MISKYDKADIIRNYRERFVTYKDGPEVAQLSREGQRFRFAKLAELADMSGASILDVGCNIADLYPFLLNCYENIQYTGIDIVPEMIAHAQQRFPESNFYCLDLIEEDLDKTFDYVLISGIFNNAIPNATDFLKEMVTKAFQRCNCALGFNFISTYVNSLDQEMAYHDPVEVFRFCVEQLSRKVHIYHHYERCDVAVYVYR